MRRIAFFSTVYPYIRIAFCTPTQQNANSRAANAITYIYIYIIYRKLVILTIEKILQWFVIRIPPQICIRIAADFPCNGSIGTLETPIVRIKGNPCTTLVESFQQSATP